MNIIKEATKDSLFVLLMAATITACRKDDDQVPVPPPVKNESEVITTMTLTFTDPAGILPTATATFRDPDGEGGSGPDIHDTIKLAGGTTYHVSVKLLNETANTAQDITDEVLEEDHDHLFCFAVSGTDISIVRTDTDGAYEVGLQSKWTTGAAGSGAVKIELKHQPGVKNGTCSPGETDIDVTYPVIVQ